MGFVFSEMMPGKTPGGPIVAGTSVDLSVLLLLPPSPSLVVERDEKSDSEWESRRMDSGGGIGGYGGGRKAGLGVTSSDFETAALPFATASTEDSVSALLVNVESSPVCAPGASTS